MSNIIDKIQLSGITYDIGGGSITIDPTLDSGSTNPVANSAITTALDEKVNVANNIVSATTINYTYDAGDTSYKYPYNKGLIINEFYVKPVNQYTYTNTAAWSNMYISNGSSYAGIKANVDCSNYQITAVTSTSGDNFTYAIEDGVLHVTLSEGYTVQSIQQNSNFVISFTKYAIESGQTADVINEDLIDVIQDIYDQTPKAFLTAATPILASNYLGITNYKSDGSNSGQFISFGSSIKGDNNKMDTYLVSRNAGGVILNTGTSSYCQVPLSTVNDYNTGFRQINLHVNTGYTGSTTSFTFTVTSITTGNTTVTDTFTYDSVNKTIGGSQTYANVFINNGTIYILSYYSSYRMLSVSSSNCSIAGIDSLWKNNYIIDSVTALSFLKQANTVINEIYTELDGKATTTYVNKSTSGKAETTAVTEAISEATSGKVDTSVYTAYTAATDTALAGKQTTLTAGTGIDITDNVISATGGGGGNPTVELTQAEYDALVTAGTVSADTYYIITDAQAGDLTQYWTSAQTQSAITQSVSGKQDTLSAGTGIDITDNVISATGGGGGKAIEAGRGITVTTGATADTVSFNLPISAGTRSNNLIIGESTNISSSNRSIATGYKTKAQQSNAFAQGYQTDAGQENSHAEGYETKAYGVNSHSEGRGTSAMTQGSHAEGLNTITSNSYEHTQGQYNVSSSASTSFGYSGNTLFSVGNGTADNARHNAFEIRQNGDIYLNNGTSDVKLQEYLQIKAVKITQSDYDALVQGGTVDANTLYIITNVVS